MAGTSAAAFRHTNARLKIYSRPEQRLEFWVLATDGPGLWDVVSSDDAVRFVRARLDRRSDHSFQAAATALTHEALVRQSTDNVGVCVVDLQGRVS